MVFRYPDLFPPLLFKPKDENKPKDSLWGLAWDVEDLEATHKRLTQLGIEATPVKEGRKPNTLVSTIKSHTCNIPTLFIQHLAS